MGYNYAKGLSNSQLTERLRKLRRENEHKEKYGNYGTGNYVSSNEAYGRSGVKQFKDELERRRKLGLIRKNTGVVRKKKSTSWFGSMRSF